MKSNMYFMQAKQNQKTVRQAHEIVKRRESLRETKVKNAIEPETSVDNVRVRLFLIGRQSAVFY